MGARRPLAHAPSLQPGARWVKTSQRVAFLGPGLALRKRQGRPLPGAADTSARCDLRVPLGRLYLRPGGTLGLGGRYSPRSARLYVTEAKLPRLSCLPHSCFHGPREPPRFRPSPDNWSLQMQTKSRNAKAMSRGRRQKSRLQTDWPASSTPPGSALLLGCQWPAQRHGEGPSG